MSLSTTNTFIKQLEELQNKTNDAELHWYINEIIIPDIPQIIETLTMCLNLLIYNSPQEPNEKDRVEKGPEIKLPISSTKSETLKGIIVRDGPYITNLNLSIKEPHINKHIHKLSLKKPILLEQIIICQNSIENSISLVNKILKQVDITCDFHLSLISIFKNLLINIQSAKTNLQLPTDPNLVFPINITNGEDYEPILPPIMSLDFYISQAEICLDLKNLHRINEAPWCEIDDNGKSYVDKLRDEMKLPKSSQPSINETNKQVDKVLEKPKNNNNFLSFLKHRHEPMEYITRCITYNNMVVMVNCKIEVSSEDPILVSCFTKLDSIDYLISGYLNSINNLM
ncbi:unnamed protein product [Candida verbasci]|uniref:Regulator of V-ATPase in vacuolar membrane protein 2 n=1 Tax=Candida verbasci TaxID=1227364 RepID=A0A9W4TZV1_9ASCO|nr:unnamed protein product [Candida verbasci]